MDYNNNVYNVDEADVQDVEEYSEPVEEVEATVVENGREISNIDTKGIIFSIISLVLGFSSASSVFWNDYSFVMCLIMSGVSGYFSFKYLAGGYHHKVFGKFAIIGFLLSIAGIVFGTARLVLTCLTSMGQAILFTLF